MCQDMLCASGPVGSQDHWPLCPVSTLQWLKRGQSRLANLIRKWPATETTMMKSRFMELGYFLPKTPMRTTNWSPNKFECWANTNNMKLSRAKCKVCYLGSVIKSPGTGLGVDLGPRGASSWLWACSLASEPVQPKFALWSGHPRKGEGSAGVHTGQPTSSGCI